MSAPLDRQELFALILRRVDELADSNLPISDLLHSVCDILREMVPEYDWVGFYLVDRENERELVLGPFVGDPTEHIRIPFGRGICGQAAETGEAVVVQDVSSEGNYLSCSVNVKSEIVVPVFKDGELIGELDIDSHQLAPFTEDDKSFLEGVASIVAKKM